MLSRDLDDEDLRRADAAMGAALDPRGNGSPVAWDNPQSGSHGSFTPVAAAYPRAKLICRAFLADVTAGTGRPKQLQGTACHLAESHWFVRDVKPWTAASG